MSDIQNIQIHLEKAKEKFANVRQTCPGLSPYLYELADYISLSVNDVIFPIGLVMAINTALNDLEKGFSTFTKMPLPQDLIEHKDKVIEQVANVPILVSKIADADFFDSFEILFKDILGYESLQNSTSLVDSSYPIYIKKAVEWWANEIMSPKLKNNVRLIPIVSNFLEVNDNGFSNDELRIFCDNLAKSVSNELDSGDNCTLSVDFFPCKELKNAGDLIGLDNFTSYPWKTKMVISKDKVVVGDFDDKSNITIYSSMDDDLKKQQAI